MNDLHFRHIRTTIPNYWSRRLAHIAAATGLTRQELLRQAVLLLIRHHGGGDDFPEAMPPKRITAPFWADE